MLEEANKGRVGALFESSPLYDFTKNLFSPSGDFILAATGFFLNHFCEESKLM